MRSPVKIAATQASNPPKLQRLRLQLNWRGVLSPRGVISYTSLPSSRRPSLSGIVKDNINVLRRLERLQELEHLRPPRAPHTVKPAHALTRARHARMSQKWQRHEGTEAEHQRLDTTARHHATQSAQPHLLSLVFRHLVAGQGNHDELCCIRWESCLACTHDAHET